MSFAVILYNIMFGIVLMIFANVDQFNNLVV